MAASPDAGPARSLRVTVVVTVLKDPRVAETLASLLAQTRLPDEVLVDDGGITDVVRTITERFHAQDPRVG